MDSLKLKGLIDNYFKQEQDENKNIFFILSLYIYQLRAGKDDLHILAKILPKKYLKKVIKYYNGDTIKTPTVEDYISDEILAICFYLKEIKHYTWEEIKEFLNLPSWNTDAFNTIVIGRKINKIKDEMTREFMNFLNSTKKQVVTNERLFDEVDDNE